MPINRYGNRFTTESASNADEAWHDEIYDRIEQEKLIEEQMIDQLYGERDGYLQKSYIDELRNEYCYGK